MRWSLLYAEETRAGRDILLICSVDFRLCSRRVHDIEALDMGKGHTAQHSALTVELSWLGWSGVDWVPITVMTTRAPAVRKFSWPLLFSLWKAKYLKQLELLKLLHMINYHVCANCCTWPLLAITCIWLGDNCQWATVSADNCQWSNRTVSRPWTTVRENCQSYEKL